MAVVNTKSDLTAPGAVDPARARGRSICATGTVTNAATDNTNSTYHLADIPADAILDSRTAFQVQNWGFATVRLGTLLDNDALHTVLKSVGNVVSPVAFGDARHGQPLWQALGLAAAPDSGMISLYAHGIADATGAGSMKFEIHYRFR